MQGLEHQSSSERIKQLVELEGKAARNLVTWSVPVTDAVSGGGSVKKVGPAEEGGSHSNSSHASTRRRNKRGKDFREKAKGSAHGIMLAEQVSRQTVGEVGAARLGSELNTPLSEREEFCKYYSSRTQQRQSRSSKSPSRLNLHARYWSYLFDNLHRAVDEIYKTCEVDESIVECQEVIMTLEVCRKDFEALIRRIQLFEQSDLHSRSANIAWEVRKTTSPSKPRALSSHHTPSPPPPSPLHYTPPPSRQPKPPQKHRPTTQLATRHSKPQATQAPRKDPAEKPKDLKITTTTSPTWSSGKSNSRPNSARSLDFSVKVKGHSGQEPVKRVTPEVHDTSPTWADRVKGLGRTPAVSKPHPPDLERSESNFSVKEVRKGGVANDEVRKEGMAESKGGVAEDEGWETVTRTRVRSGGGGGRQNRRTHPAPPPSEVQGGGAKGVAMRKTGSGDNGEGGANDKGVGLGLQDGVTGKGGTLTPDTVKDAKVISGANEGVEQKSEGAGEANKVGGADAEVDGANGKVGRAASASSLQEVDEKMGREDKDVGRADKEARQEVGGANEEVEPEMGGADMKVGGADEEVGGADEKKGGAGERGGDMDNGEEHGATVPSDRSNEVDKSVSKSTGGSEEGTQVSDKEDNDSWTWNDALAVYNANEAYRAETSWADRCDSPPGGLSEIPRSPGRAIHLHQRLSSPSRKRSVEQEESRRLQEEKQAKAQLQRSKLQEEKTNKSKVEADKIREARESRDALARQRREALEDKLQRAEMLREFHLQERIRRAQEEEAKVSEISFINTLEAQNRKIEVEEKYQGRKARLQEIEDGRQRKRDEQLAKEEAVQERRKTKEAERVAKVMEMDQRRRDQEVKVEQKFLERDRAREEAAKEKAKERERKLQARTAALQTSTEELGRKIQLKHDETSRRYDQQIEQKKKLATGVSSRHASADQAPRVEAYKTKKWCTLCNVEIVSEVYLMSHLRGRKHQSALAALPSSTLNTSASSEGEGGGDGGGGEGGGGGGTGDEGVIVDATEEQQKPAVEQLESQERLQAGKKKARKLRQRMNARAKEMENNKSGTSTKTLSKNRIKLQKALRELNKQIDSSAHPGSRLQLSSSQLPLVDRALGEINRSLASEDDQLCFCQLGGVACVLKLLVLSVENCMSTGEEWGLPLKTFTLAVNVLLNTCMEQFENSRYLVTSNKAVPLVDLCVLVLSRALSSRQQQLGAGKDEGASVCSSTTLCGPLLRLLASMVSSLASVPLGQQQTQLVQQITDAISYMVSVGVLDKLAQYFTSITGPVQQLPVTQLVLGGLNLLVATTAFLHSRVVDVFSGKTCDDPTLLTTSLRQTELAGLMQLLYAILLSDGPPRHSHSPPLLDQQTLAIAMATIKALNNSAILDLKMVQACLGAEGISLEFRHIVSYLLWYCSHYENTNLLHELILAVGYFCVLNHDNQVYLQSGRSPTLLQLLCGLPFEYFSNPKLSRLLYPTLIAACYQMEENKVILEEEISSKLLVTFLQESRSSLEEEKSKGDSKAAGKGPCTVDLSSMLQHRFPKTHWDHAISYFSQQPPAILPPSTLH